jgi:hypothetical protein
MLDSNCFGVSGISYLMFFNAHEIKCSPDRMFIKSAVSHNASSERSIIYDKIIVKILSGDVINLGSCHSCFVYEDVSLERKLQMVQLSATRWSCVAIL